MYCSLEDFTKKHDKVICIDSDGTMIDAMNVKHHRCHGASLMEVFQLKDHAEEVQEMWDSINLYERTRGVNRFIALKIMIGRINGKYVHVDHDF